MSSSTYLYFLRLLPASATAALNCTRTFRTALDVWRKNLKDYQ